MTHCCSFWCSNFVVAFDNESLFILCFIWNDEVGNGNGWYWWDQRCIAESKMQLWSCESGGSIFNTLWFEFAAETGFRLNRSRFSLHGPLSSWIHQCAALSWSFKAPHTSAIPKSTVQERILARKLYNILIFGLQCTAMHCGAMQCNEL